MAETTAWELVRLRNNFYRNNYRRMALMLMMSIILNFAFGVGLVYMYFNKPHPVYFATKADGSLLQMIPLDDPYKYDNAHRADLLKWAVDAAQAAFSFNFLDYQNNLTQARKYFTPTGFENYLAALKASGNLTTVTQKRLVVKGEVVGSPVILEQGQVGDRYAWKVQVPMLVRYVSAAMEIDQPIMVTMLIGRVSTLQSEDGISIAQFIVEDRKPTQ